MKEDESYLNQCLYVKTKEDIIKEQNKLLDLKNKILDYNSRTISIFPQQEILRSKLQVNTFIPNDCGIIYFLIKDNKIVYIGKSKSIARIFEHMRSKEFDSYNYCFCQIEQLSELEANYILYYRPIYNFVDAVPIQTKPFLKKYLIKKMFNLSTNFLNMLIRTYKITKILGGFINTKEFLHALELFTQSNPNFKWEEHHFGSCKSLDY